MHSQQGDRHFKRHFRVVLIPVPPFGKPVTAAGKPCVAHQG